MLGHLKHNPGRHAPALTGPKFVRRYISIISLVSSLLIIAIFWGFYNRTANLIEDQLLYEARAFFEEIVLTRHWIIKQQGVYIKKQPGMTPDPYLERIKGLKTTITDRSGQEYLLRNHAVVTRLISNLAQEGHHFTIHITSLNPLNPDNAADRFEKAALQSFEKGSRERFRLEKTKSGLMFRFMAPLITREECLPCHGAQGYRVGDIRGGISISIPAGDALKQIAAARDYTVYSAIALLAVLLSVIIYISRHLVNDLRDSEKRLVELATTDALTGVLNRGEGMRRFQLEISRSLRKRQSLSVILIDIDYFKKINDNFGHQTGDLVIELIAGKLAMTLRDYDIICRYGGEEFLVILPDTGLDEARETAERLRKVVEEMNTRPQDGKPIKLTISLGVTNLQTGDSLDGLVYRADNALYIAKEEGRNQVQYIT